MAPSVDHPAPFSAEDPGMRPNKRRRIVHHQIHHKQALDGENTLPEPDVHDLLKRSIGIALTAAGFDAVNQLALDSFRALTEQYILHLLLHVNVSMLSCRRALPIPQDFSWFLAREGLSLSDLAPYLQPMAPPSILQPPLRPASPTREAAPEPPLSPLLGPLLTSRPEKEKRPYIPKSFPAFPSKHTYKFTQTASKPDGNPRRVRELAVTEARLGEEALRRLVGNLERSAAKGEERVGQEQKRGRRAQLEAVWRQAMQKLDKEVKGVPTLGGIVNYEQRFWRKVPAAPKEKPSGGEVGIGTSEDDSDDDAAALDKLLSDSTKHGMTAEDTLDEKLK